jgi:phage gp36-like protein
MYSTPEELIAAFGLKELSHLATPQEYPPVPETLLSLTIFGGDRSEFTEEQILAADETLTTLQQALEFGQKEINSYVNCHYLLPLPTETVGANPLKERCNDIARYRLAKNYPSEEITKRYEDAKIWLRDIASGRAILLEPSNDTDSIEPQMNKVLVGRGRSCFDWSGY